MSRAAGGKKFGKLDVKRVYFGNWLRDYSQAVDVGTVKYISANAITFLLWILGFMSFGYGELGSVPGSIKPSKKVQQPKNSRSPWIAWAAIGLKNTSIIPKTYGRSLKLCIAEQYVDISLVCR